MIDTKFLINDEIFVVQDYKVVKCRIEEIVLRFNEEGEKLEYIVSPLIWEKQGKKKLKSFSASYIVATFDEAKKAAQMNWENISKRVKFQLENLTEQSYDKIENGEDK